MPVAASGLSLQVSAKFTNSGSLFCRNPGRSGSGLMSESRNHEIKIFVAKQLFIIVHGPFELVPDLARDFLT